MDFITHVQQALLAQLPGIIKGYVGGVSATSLSEMETVVRQMTHELGNGVMQQWLEAQDAKYPADQQPCPSCGELAA